MSDVINCNGYHGTSIEAYEQILKVGFKSEIRKDHWLGQGVYFFLDDYQEAKWFSKQCKAVQYHKQRPCVLKADIIAKHNKVLNADTNSGREIFDKSYCEILEEFRQHNIQIEDIDENRMRCIIFDNIEDIDVILKAFPQGVSSNSWKKGSARYLPPMQIQICVRNQDCIKNLQIA